MIEFLNPIRSVEKDISISRKIINTIFILLLGLALGTFSKYLDYKHADLKGLLMYIDCLLYTSDAADDSTEV